MASVTSLGLHQPTGLQHAIQEQFLPNDPSTSSYTWHNICDSDSNDAGDDELLVTSRCVIWSRGGVFRKSYKFDLEKEPVTQALLTSFPIVDPLVAKSGGQNKAAAKSSTNAAAIVVFLKTQAHVYFLSGTNHVIHLPFEVESASAAPNGLIIQRKIRTDNTVSTSLKFPRVPPNSFVSSQPQPWSASTSQQSTFSIADLNAPKPLLLPPISTLKDMWDPPVMKDDSNWPRLFSLTDPLSEMGLVVSESSKSETRARRRSSVRFSTLDAAEEILYVSRKSELPNSSDEEPLILAVTLNRDTSTYTVWKMSYIGHEAGGHDKQRVSSGAGRRSSFVPGTGTGATTPVLHGKKSYGGNGSVLTINKGPKKDDGSKPLDLASTLDPEFEGTLPRRKSRRVSSMLARADLSASLERSAFSELANGHPSGPSKRGESIGGQAGRKSSGQPGLSHQTSQFNHSINSYLEAPVDDLLDELHAGGDFEGFHNMGLEDEEFDALRQEIVFAKICSVPAEHANVRFSSQYMPAKNQCKLLTLTAPSSALDDPQTNLIVICILDSDEKKLLLLSLHAKRREAAQTKHGKGDKKVTTVTLGSTSRAKNVVDICRIDDGLISRILVLNESVDEGGGQSFSLEAPWHGEGGQSLSLQAPWSVLMRLSLPREFMINNTRSLGHNATPRARREGGFKRVFSQGPRSLRGLCNPKPRGLVDIVDEQGKMHQIQIVMQPRNPRVCKILEVCTAVLPGSRGGGGLLFCWWGAMQWLQVECTEVVGDLEWSALVITFFSLTLGLDESSRKVSTRPPTKQRRSHSFLRSSSGAQAHLESWEEMQKLEAYNGNPSPAWANNNGWRWTTEQEEMDSGPLFPVNSNSKRSFLQNHVKLTREFIISTLGQSTAFSLPTWNTGDGRGQAALGDVFMGLHLLREEEKLGTMTVDSFSVGSVSLLPVLLQIARWLNWKSCIEVYSVEEATLLVDNCENQSLHTSPVPEPTEYPSIYDWIQNCLMVKGLLPFLTLPELVANRAGVSSVSDLSPWKRLTPRTISFASYFSSLRSGWSSAQNVEAMSAAGMTPLFLETLPEAVLAPLREAIAQCQAEPPTSWPEELLAMVGREDVNTLLTPRQKTRNGQSTLLAPSHESSLDIHSICNATADAELHGSFDGSAEVDRQAITRSIFKDDRRVNEAINILTTSKPTIAHIKAEPEWSESDLLEAQKEHAQMLAVRTLAIPSGRGLIYYSSRIPLLTQRLAIGGFNLSCIMKPENNTVGVDKSNFTEEKICWAFFHAGVATGLSISRDARGIDSSWILYNKPVQDLSNRHAGFLLALGLNGHLKYVAKWVAFKYLTPKHTMTSIGLLLGLAASYMGTMDSLVTRLLSVHVTRMLPPGAAELNLSPLTQTTGIMGIGLLYCNTQHRRMSEIMVSEIEHIDQETEEEPLRNEGYRLAAGFALGFINLGKGSDLKGLHDMHLTERLLTLAAGSKKVDLVHVLDKATAAAVVAIALIFMKSENQVAARKVDVPDSILQFDYVRPDIFLLRTLARHLIMWSKIEPTSDWIKKSLPLPYKHRSTLERIKVLTSEDLPFYDIITGLCFAIALRFAGSASFAVRDLLIQYLDQFMRICRIEANTFDKKLTRNTVRNCQDLIALSVSTVMAGTGDLSVFRRLRSMHGRDDNETPYGSHLAAHLAIGALFLGGGRFTFGTSNIAIAALLVAFYPIFPSSVHDNKSHLQAFRHFWVLATEARCLVTRDIDTNQPVPLPILITLHNGQETQRHTPCLLPELNQIETVRIDSPEFWNVVLDLQNNSTHIASFQSTQTIYVRRRPAHDASTHAFKATLQALNDIDITSPQPLEWLFNLPALSSLTKAERALVLPPDHGGASGMHGGTDETVIDARLVLEHASVDSGKRDRLLGLRLLFEWAEKELSEVREMQWVRREVVQRLQAEVWMREGGG